MTSTSAVFSSLGAADLREVIFAIVRSEPAAADVALQALQQHRDADAEGAGDRSRRQSGSDLEIAAIQRSEIAAPALQSSGKAHLHGHINRHEFKVHNYKYVARCLVCSPLATPLPPPLLLNHRPLATPYRTGTQVSDVVWPLQEAAQGGYSPGTAVQVLPRQRARPLRAIPPHLREVPEEGGSWQVQAVQKHARRCRQARNQRCYRSGQQFRR